MDPLFAVSAHILVSNNYQMEMFTTQFYKWFVLSLNWFLSSFFLNTEKVLNGASHNY